MHRYTQALLSALPGPTPLAVPTESSYMRQQQVPTKAPCPGWAVRRHTDGAPYGWGPAQGTPEAQVARCHSSRASDGPVWREPLDFWVTVRRGGAQRSSTRPGLRHGGWIPAGGRMWPCGAGQGGWQARQRQAWRLGGEGEEAGWGAG